MSEELKKCAVCGMKIPVDAQMCPYCRSIQPQRVERSSSGCLNIIGGIVLTLIILAAICSICSSHEPDQSAEQQSSKTEEKVQQPTTSSKQEQPAIPANSSLKNPSARSLTPTTSNSSSTSAGASPTMKDEQTAKPQGVRTGKKNTTTSDEVPEQRTEFEQRKTKDITERQTKRQERKEKRQAKKNNKQAEEDKAK